MSTLGQIIAAQAESAPKLLDAVGHFGERIIHLAQRRAGKSAAAA
jgi:hypothetical protein